MKQVLARVNVNADSASVAVSSMGDLIVGVFAANNVLVVAIVNVFILLLLPCCVVVLKKRRIVNKQMLVRSHHTTLQCYYNTHTTTTTGNRNGVQAVIPRMFFTSEPWQKRHIYSNYL